MAGEAGGGSENLSMSTSASNALREKLGLKPLRDGPTKKEAEMKERDQQQQDEHAQAETEVQLEMKLEKMKNKRLLTAEVEGPSTAEMLKAKGEKAATSSFADWVQHSRKLTREQELAKKREAELNAQDEEKDNYTSADIAGMTVAHDSDAIRDGETVIMTLKDSSIVDDQNGES